MSFCAWFLHFKVVGEFMLKTGFKKQMKKCQSLILVLFTFFGFQTYAYNTIRNYDDHPGYISNPKNEVDDPGVEIPYIDKPVANQITLKEIIFNSELSKEFKDRYEDKFGRTQPERVYNSSNKYTYYDDLYTLQGTPSQVDDQERAFGNYMMARLVEYHFDYYLKSDPSMRTIYETKERLSQVKIEVDEVKFDAKYSLAGNLIDVRARAPWVDTKITLGSGQRILSFTREQTPTVGLEARYLDVDRKVAWIITKRFGKFFTTSFTASACTGDSSASPRETLYLSGTSYNF